MAPFRAQSARVLVTHVCVGVGAASFWRGAWYILDDHLFPQDATKSAAASMALGVAGLTASQGLVERAERLAARNSGVRPASLAVARFGAVYSVATSCVLIWRATWLGWDILYEYLHPAEETKSTDPGHAALSGLLSHGAALGLLLGTGLFASVLAPPAAICVIRDQAVRSGPMQYMAPAQSIVNQIIRNGSTTSSSISSGTTTTAAGSHNAVRAFSKTTAKSIMPGRPRSVHELHQFSTRCDTTMISRPINLWRIHKTSSTLK